MTCELGFFEENSGKFKVVLRPKSGTTFSPRCDLGNGRKGNLPIRVAGVGVGFDIPYPPTDSALEEEFGIFERHYQAGDILQLDSEFWVRAT